MSTYHLPDLGDTRDTIADCLTALQIAPAALHEQIIENSLGPVALLFMAGKMASQMGPDERAVFSYFLSMMEAQANAAEMVSRRQNRAWEEPVPSGLR